MNLVPISKVAQFINGRAFKPEEWEKEGLPIIRIQNLTGSSQVVNYFSGNFEQKYLVTKGDILISWSASLGVYKWEQNNAILNQHIFKVVVKDDLVDKNYFYYAAQNILNDMIAQIHGATMQHITRDPFLAIKIPLPPKHEQQRIARILEKADRLRRMRQYARQLGDTYLQSVFVEMFGDPKVNEKHWNTAKFSDVCESRLGKMLDEKQQTGKHKRPYLRNLNIQWGYIDMTDVALMDFNDKERKEFKLCYGDVLICEGGEVGRTAIWRDELPECYFQKALHRVRPNNTLVNSEYILWIMWWLAKTGGLKDFTSQVTIAHLTGVKLKELIIPVPPLSLQIEFTQIIQKYERLHTQQGEAERQAEMLFQSVLERAFQGEV